MSTTAMFYHGRAHNAEDFIHRSLHFLDCYTDTPPQCSLDNPIHPLFALPKWRGVTNEMYNTIKPALQLASLWITDDRVLDWFYEDSMGVVQHRQDLDNRRISYLSVPGNLKNDPDYRAEARKVWNQKIALLSSVLKLHLYDGEERYTAYGSMYVFDPRNIPTNSQPFLSPFYREGGKSHAAPNKWAYNGTEVPVPVIIISNIFRAFFMRKEYGNEIERLNGLLFLAVVLCHELAHVVAQFPRFQCLDSETGRWCDAFHSLDEATSQSLFHLHAPLGNGKPEVGYSWEMNMFGGVPQPHVPLTSQTDATNPHSYRQDTYSPFSIFSNDEWWMMDQMVPNGQKENTLGMLTTVVYPAQYLLRWFRKEFWDEKYTTEDILSAPPFRIRCTVWKERLGLRTYILPRGWGRLQNDTEVNISVCVSEDHTSEG